MNQYRAIISINFDDEDIKEYAEMIGVSEERLSQDVDMLVNGVLDNIEFGSTWLEQLFINKNPSILRLTEGTTVEVSPHED